MDLIDSARRIVSCIALALTAASLGCKHLESSGVLADSSAFKFDFEPKESWSHEGKTRFKGIFWLDRGMPQNRIIEFDFDYEIYESWRFKIISHTGNHYVIQSTAPNTDSFVFLAEGKDGGRHGPTKVELGPKFDYQRNEVWPVEGGKKRFKGTIWLDRDLERDTKIAFDYNYEIYEFWRFKILEHAGNRYVIQLTDPGTDSLVFLAQGWDDGWNAPYNVQFGVDHGGGGPNPIPPPETVTPPPPAATESPKPPVQVDDKAPPPAEVSVPTDTPPAATAATAPPQKPDPESKPEPNQAPWGTPVGYNGRLKVVGTELRNQNGQPIQLKGVSTHGLQWNGKFANPKSISWLKNSWNASMVRIAMYTDENGFLAQPWIKDKVHEIVRLAIAEGLYVIIDWHILKDRDPMWNVGAAKAFFDEMSRTYAKYPNVIYEICNEPNGEDVTWDRSIKPYAEQVIPVIRRNDPHNIIIVGTPRWSSELDAPARNRLGGDLATNVMYSFHYYAGSHGDVSGKLSAALDRGLPIFVSEWGVSTADGRSGVARGESDKFLAFLAWRKISWAAWSLADDGNASSLLIPGTEPETFRRDAGLSEAGRLIKGWLWAK